MTTATWCDIATLWCSILRSTALKANKLQFEIVFPPLSRFQELKMKRVRKTNRRAFVQCKTRNDLLKTMGSNYVNGDDDRFVGKSKEGKGGKQKRRKGRGGK